MLSGVKNRAFEETTGVISARRLIWNKKIKLILNQYEYRYRKCQN